MRSRQSGLLPVTLFALLTFIGAAPATAQSPIHAGAYAAHATEAFDGTTGIGALVTLDLPVLPVDIRATGERFFPECEIVDGVELDGCTFWGYSLDVNLHFPIFFVQPYVTGGLQFRFLDPGDAFEGTDESGLSLGGGVELALGSLHAFGEARYEFIELPEEQWIARVGLIVF